MIVAAYRNTERSIRERGEMIVQAALPDLIEEARQTAVDIVAKAHERATEIITDATQWAKAILDAKTPPEPEPSPNRPLVNAIIREVADRHGFAVSYIKGPRKFVPLVEARMDAIAAVYEKRPDLSLATIGRLFNRDHTSVLHAVQKRNVWRRPGAPGKRRAA